jgi:hypothetical protein
MQNSKRKVRLAGGVDPAGSGYGRVASSCEYGYEPSGSGAKELVKVTSLGCRDFKTKIHENQ